VIEAAFIEGAKKQKRGQQAKAGALSDGFWPLEYDGPKEPERLWTDERFRLSVGVRVQRNRIMRMRPIFREWESQIEIDYLADQLNGEEVVEIMRNVGRIVGLCDWRPKFGRFEVVNIA
jgi:hypothetical protein